jgi:voltage-dependent calcium channel L type alpha-1D
LKTRPDEEDEDEEDYEDEKAEPVSARPRRMSEVSVKKGKKPIPKGSAFFIFSNTNK